jgi:hypothetical protein
VGGALLALALALTVRRRAAGGAATESTVEVGPTV